jgi:hypothetical protein
MTTSNLRRWLYQGKRPNWIAKQVNQLVARMYGLGIGSTYSVTLEIIGRKSGKILSLPLIIAIVDGQRYVVSMLGENSQWVQNVRAAGGEAALRSGQRELVRLEELPTEQRAPIIKAYLQHATGARAHFPISVDAPLDEIEKIANQYPVFHVVTIKIG